MALDPQTFDIYVGEDVEVLVEFTPPPDDDINLWTIGFSAKRKIKDTTLLVDVAGSVLDDGSATGTAILRFVIPHATTVTLEQKEHVFDVWRLTDDAKAVLAIGVMNVGQDPRYSPGS